MRFRFLTLALLAGCNPYDGEVGPTPFLCGPTEPRCPMSYTCMADAIEGTEICVGEDGVGPSPFTCADDSAVEPNGTIATASPTDADATRSLVLDNLAICPERDKDIYAVTLAANETLEMIVTFGRDGAPLRGTLLNTGGVPIASTGPSTTGTIRASAPILSAGVYYAQVVGPDGTPTVGTNNYTLTLNVTGP